MPNPIRAVTGEVIEADSYANAVTSRLMLIYPNTTTAGADNPTPEDGQIRHVVTPGLIQFFIDAAWVDWRRLYDSEG